MLTEIKGRGRVVAAFGTVAAVLFALAPQTTAAASLNTTPSPLAGEGRGGGAVHSTTVGPARVFRVPRLSVLPNRSVEKQAQLDAATRVMNRHRVVGPAPGASGGAGSSVAASPEAAANFRTPPRDLPPPTFTVFRQSNPPGKTLPNTPGGRWNPSDIDEPSVSNNGSAVFYTGNWYAAQSPDSGANWTYIDPGAFPTADGGFCCDQVTIYDPVNNITIWELLYAPVAGTGTTAGNNRVRLAVANGQAGVNTNVWHTFDITSADVMAPAGSWLDYPQLGLSQNNLFLTANGFQGPPTDRGCYTSPSSQCVQVNSYAVRIPLASLAATGTLPVVQWVTYSCTNMSCLDTLTPVQQVGSIMYFGAHGGAAIPDTTILRVYEWPDSSNAAPVRNDVPDAAFTYMLGADGSCFASGVNPCARDDSRVKVGWLNNGEIGFAWDAKQGGTYSYPYVRAARVRLFDFSLIQDFTIAFQSVGAIYPSIAANARGGLGLTFTEAGGADSFPMSDIGIWDDLGGPWEMKLLAIGTGANQGNWWGDYLTIRPASGTGNSGVATGFTVQGSGVQPIFAWFGRSRDDPFTARNLTCGAAITSAMGAQTPGQLMATFTATSGSLLDYVATIDWGDGTTPSKVMATGTTAPNGATVSATHAFASAGSRTVTVSIGPRTYTGVSVSCTLPATITGSVYTTASTSQYALQNSDGSTWQPIDATHLVLKITPATDSTAILSANADLWTQNAGINQDIGIAVSGGTGPGPIYPTVAGQPETWKESGGFAGTFSPNAAYVQSAVPLNAGMAYTITLVWKANKPAAGTTIRAGAGPLFVPPSVPAPPITPTYSPVRLTAQLIPGPLSPNPNFAQKLITTQPLLSGSNGSTWRDMDGGLTQSFTAPGDGTLVIGGNADLWTANGGYNQDIGIAVSGGTGVGPIYPSVPGQPEAWKESGGYGGIQSPNAAFVQAIVPVKSGVPYQVKLQWKTNRPSGAIIVAGAGPIGGVYSPTTMTIQFFASTNVVNASLTASQPVNPSSDGSTFTPIDSNNLSAPIPSSSMDCVAILGGNADLWTSNAGYNQDIAIWVNGNLLGWKESGGFAGTFSPNAAFVQSVIPVPMNTTPALLLQWKANIDARTSSARIYAGAGPIGGRFSPTRLSAEIICS